MFTIREGRKEDCHQLVEMFKELAEHQKQTDGLVVTADQLANDGFGNQSAQQYRLFVAQLNSKPDQLIGYALYYPKYSTWTGRGVWLESLFVKKELRGSGLGVALMASVARQALADGCARFDWDCYAFNDKSMDFYKKLGAKDITHDSTDCVQTIFFRLEGQKLRQLADRK